jgi:hypothetical protein
MGVVACTCHPKLLGRLRKGGLWFQASLGKKVGESLSGKKLGVVVCNCHPSNSRKHKIGESPSRLVWVKDETLFPK